MQIDLASIESSVVGTLLAEFPAKLPPNISRIVKHAPESFDDERHGEIAAAMRRLNREGAPVHVASVRDALNGKADFVWICALSANALPLDLAEFEAEKLWTAYQQRQTKAVLSDALASMEAAPDKAQLIAENARQALEQLDDDRGPGALPEIIDAATFIAEPIEAPAELVAGVLHKGSKLAFGGSSKSFKTWNLLDLALSVATGSNWLGFSTTQGNVLFVNFEIQLHAWQKRVSAVAKAKGIALRPGAVRLLNLRGHAADFRRLIPKIIESTKAEGFALIVLDPIYKLYGGTDENAAGDVAELLNEIERLATETGAAVAFGAHFAKGNASGKEAIDRISGSGVFARDPDSLLIFTKHEAEDAFTVEPILRNFAPVAPFAVRWTFPLMQRADDLDPAKLKQAGGRAKIHTAEKLLATLGNKSLTTTEWQALAGSEEGIPRRTFYELMKELAKADRIHKSATNDKWQRLNK